MDCLFCGLGVACAVLFIDCVNSVGHSGWVLCLLCV